MKHGAHLLDPRKLYYFAVIVQHRSLGKAAKALGVSQPALSMSMDRLEKEVGTPLLERRPTGVEMTPTGELIERHARQILSSMVTANAALHADCANGPGRLHFGCLPTLAGSVIPQAIRHWRDSFPELELHITERPQNELLWGLLNREFDFAIGVVDKDNHAFGLRQRVLFRERLHVVGRVSHPLSSRTTITLDDLVGFPWVSPTTGWRNTALEHILENAGLALSHKVTVCCSISLLKSLVATTDHLALLPAHAIQEMIEATKLCILPFQLPDLERSIAVFLREGTALDPASDLLVDLVRQHGRTRYVAEAQSGQAVAVAT
jgi:DNA-binding transcriptional LysR family regulator